MAVSGSAVTLTLSSAVAGGETVTVSYTAPATNPLRDAAGNAVAALTGQTVANITGDMTAPALSTASVTGAALTLTYGEALDATSVPAADAFTVKADDSEVALANTGAVAISGSTVTLTLAAATTAGQTVTVSYAVPATARVRDLAGNAAAALTDQAVINTLTPVVTVTRSGGQAASVTEGARIEFTIAASPEPAAALTVNYRISGADAFGVFTDRLSGSLEPGSTLGISTSTVNDVLDEADDDLRVTVLAGDGYRVGTPASAAVTIQDDDALPGATSISSVTAGAAQLTVAWSAPTDPGYSDGTDASHTDNAVTAYDVRHILTSATDKSDAQWTVVDGAWTGGDLEYALAGLTDIQSHDVQVRAVTQAGDGPWSATRTGTPMADNTPPSLSAAAVNGAALTLTYDEALDTNSVPAESAFTVLVNGSTVALANAGPVAISGSAVTLTLAAATAAGDTVTVSYAAPTNNPIQDLSGNAAAALTDRAVINALTPAVTVTRRAGQAASVTEGATGVGFTIAASPEPAAALAVNFRISGGDAFGVRSDTDTRELEPGSTLSVWANTVNDALDEADSDLKVTVVAGTGYRVGTPASAAVTIQDDDALAGAPAIASVTAGAAQLTVAWSAPTDPGYSDGTDASHTENAVTAYDVRHILTSASDKSDSQWTVVTDAWTSGDLEYAIANLTAGSSYDVQVRAVTQAGAGPWSGTSTGTPEAADTTPPALADTNPASVNGATLTLTYNETLDTAHVPASGAFTVTVAGSTRALADTNPVAVSGSTVTLTLSPAVTAGQTVTVSYALPSQAANRLQDAAGNEAATLTNQAVTNNTLGITGVADATVAENVEWTSGTPTLHGAEGTVTWSLGGADAADFAIVSTTGVVNMVARDFENPADADADNVYEATVTATDSASTPNTATAAFQVTVTDVAVPAKPSAPTVAATSGSTTSLDVSWTAVTGATSYDLQYRQGTAGNWTNGPQDVTGTSSAIASLTASTSYQVQVRAGNAEGDGAWSDAGTGTTAAPAAEPYVPRTFRANPGSRRISFRWAAPQAGGQTGYEIRHSTNASFPAGSTTTISDISPTADVQNAIRLTNGTTYHAQIRAKDSEGTFGPWSYTLAATPGGAADRHQPSNPFQPRLTAGDGQLTVAWSAPGHNGSTITTYDVRYREEGTTGWTEPSGAEWEIGRDTELSWTITGLTNGTTYEVAVRATNAIGNSGWSIRQLGTPMAAVADTTPPALAAANPATVNGTALVLTYDEALDTNSVPASSAFTVTVAGSTRALANTSPVAISGSAVTLTLASAVTAGQAVTVSYTAPATNPIKDAADNNAGNLSNQAVTNATPGIVLSPTSLRVAEGDTGTYTVELNTQPTGNVTVTVARSLGSDDVTFDTSTASGVQTTLTFTTDSWSTAQTVTVSAAADTDTDDDSATLSHTASGGGYASHTADLTVTVTDAGDTTDPALSAATVNGSTLTLTYNEPLDTNSVPASSAFAVTVAGATAALADPDPVAVSGSAVTLTLASAVTAGQTVTVSYTVPTGMDAMPIRDAAGNDAAALTNEAVANNTPGIVLSPTSLTVAEGGSGTYTVRLNTQPTGNVTVTVARSLGSDDVTFDTSTASGVQTTLTFTMDNWSTAQTVTVSAAADTDTDNDSATLAHTATGGGYASHTADLSVMVSDAGDTTDPALSTASVNGSTLTLTYNEALDTNSAPASSAFSVSVAGTARTVSNVAVSGSAVTLTLASAVTAGQTVTVSYTVPTGDSATPIRDAAGNDAAALTNEVVANNTPGIVLSPTSLTVAEGGTGTYTVRLNTQPTGNVTVTVARSGSTDVSFDTSTASGVQTTLAFTTGNWSTAQTVTVSAAADTDTDIDSATLAHTAMGGGYDSFAADLSVTVSDAGDTTDPALSAASVNGSTLTLTYNEALDTNSMPASSAFSVTVAGSTRALDNTNPVAISGSAVTLTLASAVTAGQTVTVSYTVPDTNPIQDAAGNGAAALTNEAVTNNTVGITGVADATVAENVEWTSGTPTFHGADGTVTWSLGGTDAADFAIVSATGVASMAARDYENPADANTNNVYEATVTATDSATPTANTATAAFQVTVTDVAVPAKPSAPTVAATSGSTTSLDVSWTAVTGATSYDLQYRQGTAGNWTNGPQDVTGTSSAIASLTASTSYQVQVRAGNAEGDGAWSDAGTGTTAAPAMETYVPRRFRAAPQASTRLRYIWQAPAAGGQTGYEIRYSTDSSFPAGSATETLENIPANQTIRNATGLTQNTVYYAQIRAKDGEGTFGPWSYTLAAQTGHNALDPLAPGGLAVAAGDRRLTATWNAADGRGSTIVEYHLRHKASTASSWTETTAWRIGENTALSFAITGLSNGTQYDVQVRAVSTADESPWSGTQIGTPMADAGDTTPPALSTAAVNGATLTLTYNEALDTDSVPASSAFAVTAGGSAAALADANAVAVSGSAVTLTLASAVTAGQTVTMSYTVPDTNPIQDAADNEAAALTDQAVTNNTADSATGITLSVSPTSVSEGASATTVTVTATLAGGTRGSATPVTVTVGASGDSATEGTDYATVSDDVSISVAAGAATGTGTFTLTPTQDTDVEGDETITLDGSTTVSGLTVTDSSLTLADDDADNTAPTLSTAAVNGASLVLTYNEALDTTSVPASSAFGVTVAGATAALADANPVAVSGSAVTLTLASAVTAGQTVTVSYTVPSGMDAKPIQDAAGNEAAALTDQAVTNNTADSATGITLSVSPTSVSEAASATTVTVTATLTGGTRGSATPVTVTVGASGDSATEGTDYATVSDDVSISVAAGAATGTGTFTLTPTQDTDAEGGETITLDGSTTVSGLTVTDATLTLADDDTANTAPAFASDTATRSFAENTAAGTNIGDAVTATDADNDALTYALGGTDAASFQIVADTGQLQTKSGVTYDFETKSSYSVTVTASDGNGGSDSIGVTITLTDVVETSTLAITGLPNAAVDENATFTSATPGVSGAIGAVTWTLEGTDAADFTINSGTGVVSMVGRDYENPADADTNNVYAVTVKATDSDGNSATHAFTVTVNDVVETATLAITGLANATVNENAAFTSATPGVSGAIGAVTWTLEGTDAADFTIAATTGVVSMIARDFENPADADTNNVYAGDGEGDGRGRQQRHPGVHGDGERRRGDVDARHQRSGKRDGE